MREAVEEFNRGDLEAALDRLHPEVEWQTLDAFPDAGIHRGPEAVRGFFQTWQDTFRGFRLHLESCVPVDGSRAAAVSGAGAESSRPSRFRVEYRTVA